MKRVVGIRNDVVLVIRDIVAGHDDVRAGKMFGFPAFFLGRRLFACVYVTGVGLKIPHEVAVVQLGKPHIVPFRPYGKAKMREWIEIRRGRAEDYRKDRDLFCISMEFVRGRSS